MIFRRFSIDELLLLLLLLPCILVALADEGGGGIMELNRKVVVALGGGSPAPAALTSVSEEDWKSKSSSGTGALVLGDKVPRLLPLARQGAMGEEAAEQHGVIMVIFC